MYRDISYEQKKRIMSLLGQIEFEGKSIYDIVFNQKYFDEYINTESDIVDFAVLEEFVKEFINNHPERFERYLANHPEHTKKYLELTEKKQLNSSCKTTKKSDIVVKENTLEWQEITPYVILDLEEKEYPNEELLEAVGIKIKSKKLIKNKNIREHQINAILDAYNEIKK